MAAHGAPADGMCCLTTFDDITAENYVEYQTVRRSQSNTRCPTTPRPDDLDLPLPFSPRRSADAVGNLAALSV